MKPVIISYANTHDSEPVRHGRWIPTTLRGYYECSVCRYEHSSDPNKRFCPYCGAQMDAWGKLP